MRRSDLICVVVFLTVTALAGCGGDSEDGPPGASAGSGGGGGGGSAPATPGRNGLATVAGGVSARSNSYRAVLSLGEAPGGSNNASSETYTCVGGVVASTQESEGQ